MSRLGQILTILITFVFSNGIVTLSVADSNSTSSHPDDWRWSEGYGLPGTEERVYALAVGGDGLYAGGRFETAGSAVAHYVARWDGMRWNRLGSGLDVYVNAIAAEGTDIYVGGGFHDAGGVPVEHIAKWDGTVWSALGPGVNGQVYAIDTDGGDVYAGGSFNLSGSTSVANIARWDGVQWNEVGGGTNGVVRTVLVHGGDLYIGGQFAVVGGDSINGIAMWNGLSWSQIGAGLDGVIYDIVTDGTDIYTANVVTSVYGTVIESWVQKWDGVSWSVVGHHFDASTEFDGMITDLAIVDGTIYCGGDIYEGYDLWKLTGSLWLPISDKVCLALVPYNGDLIVGGDFGDIGGVRACYITGFNGSTYYPLTETMSYGFGGAVYDIALDGSDMYVGGDFAHVGTQAFSRIARWDGTQWNQLGSGVDFSVRAVAVNGSNVFVGGYIHGGPQQWEAKLERWDGSAWHDMTGGYTSGEVTDIVVWNGDVYVGGRFTEMGGVPLIGIGRWSGGAWHDVGGGVWGDYNDQSVFCLAAGDDALYAGGRFFGAGADSTLRIAKWDGADWSPLGEGLILHPFTIAVDGDKVYAGGVINTAGGIPANGVAMWDGTNWNALGSGVISTVNSSVVVGHHVYFGGRFVDAGGNGIDYLARWDGNDWHPLGSGLGGGYTNASALASDGNFLYVGGSFTIAGDKASVAFGKWFLQETVPVLVQSFAAIPGTGRVELSWTLAGDPEVVGFWINRKDLRTGRQTVLNETMLPPGTSMFVDNGVQFGETYRYWLEVVQHDGTIQSVPRDATVAPYILSLSQNVPNPFNPSTSIAFTTAELQRVKLIVFDVKGRLVATLVDEIRPPGTYQAEWNGTDNAGKRVATGVYFVRLRAGTQTLTKKISLVK